MKPCSYTLFLETLDSTHVLTERVYLGESLSVRGYLMHVCVNCRVLLLLAMLLTQLR